VTEEAAISDFRLKIGDWRCSAGGWEVKKRRQDAGATNDIVPRFFVNAAARKLAGRMPAPQTE
jgi:hypothetical protein